MHQTSAEHSGLGSHAESRSAPGERLPHGNLPVFHLTAWESR
jgi:hypothetical protein